MVSAGNWDSYQAPGGDWSSGGYSARPTPGYAASGYGPTAGYSQPGSYTPYGGWGQGLPAGMYFDQASGLVLPLGVQLASAGRRIGAWALAIPLSIVTLGIGYIIWGLIVWGRGQTPALQVLGMRCWRPQTGRVPGWWYMALREVVGGFVENLLNWVTLLTSFVLMLATRDRRSLHDMIAGTVVLHDPGRVLTRYC
jgi:uncharacterized RDD family membrane protein YckC